MKEADVIAKIKGMKKLPDEEVKRIIDALKDIPFEDFKSPFESFVNRGIKPCVCNGTGKIKIIGGTGESPCPYCSPKIC